MLNLENLQKVRKLSHLFEGPKTNYFMRARALLSNVTEVNLLLIS
jgi:hypothetical protein